MPNSSLRQIALLLLCLALALLPGDGQAQEPGVIPEPWPFSDRYPAEITLASPADLETLYLLGIDLADLRNVDGARPLPGEPFKAAIATVNVNENEARRLADSGLTVQAIPNLSMQAFRAYGPGSGAPNAWPTFEAFVARMQGIADGYPDLVRMVSIGQSVLGRELWLLKISDNPDLEEDEAEIRYSSTMHGNEAVGTELTIRLAELLTENYGIDPQLTELVDEMEIWLAPFHNPDGYVSGSRYNAHGVDLNRDFPDPVTDPVDDPTGREPETQAFMFFGYDHNINMGANYHTGALVVNYPWDGTGHTPPDSPDNDLYYNYSVGYAVRNAMIWNGGFDHGVTQGWEWYTIRGGMQDWTYNWHGEHHVTIEVSNQQPPPYEQMDAYWDANQDAMLWWMGRALTGVRGLVTDAASGDPLEATVTVAETGLPIYTDPQVGDYHRLLLSGDYNLSASAFCHPTMTLPASVISGTITLLDFPLESAPLFSVSGQVTDAATGLPLEATIEVLDTPITAYSDPLSGEYSLQACAGEYTLRVSAPLHRPQERQITLDGDQVQDFSLEALPCTLLVDDDLGDNYQTWYQAALEALGQEYDLWSVAADGSPALDDLAGYGRLVWLTGDDASTSLTTGDQAALTAYLDGGGHLFLSGQDIGFDIGATAFYANYLHADYDSDDTNAYDLTGLDYLSGVDVNLQGGDGANNQTSPSDIAPLNGGTAVFDYPGAHLYGGVAYQDDTYASVYFSFGYEAIDNLSDRTEVLSRTLDYLGGCPALLPDLGGSTKTASADEALPGERLAYTLRVQNSGAPTTATLTDTLPLEVAWTGELTATAGLPLFADGSIHWSNPLAQGEVVTITYAVTANACLASGLEFANQAELDDGAGSRLTRSASATVLNGLPSVPAVPSPGDGYLQQPLTLTLGWAASADLNCDALTYDLYFGAADPPPLVAQGLASPAYALASLQPHTTYYWSVTVSDGYAQIGGPVWSFTTLNHAPATPTQPDPPDGASDVPVNPLLSWLGSDPDGEALTFSVAFGSTDPPPLIAEGLPAPVYDPGLLSPETTYFWSIIASDGAAQTSSPTWSFTTGEEARHKTFLPTLLAAP